MLVAVGNFLKLGRRPGDEYDYDALRSSLGEEVMLGVDATYVVNLLQWKKSEKNYILRG